MSRRIECKYPNSTTLHFLEKGDSSLYQYELPEPLKTVRGSCKKPGGRIKTTRRLKDTPSLLISKEFRRQGREPVHAAESQEAADEWISPEPLPPDQAISNEEKLIPELLT